MKKTGSVGDAVEALAVQIRKGVAKGEFTVEEALAKVSNSKAFKQQKGALEKLEKKLAPRSGAAAQRVFSKAEYDKWLSELPRRPAPTTRPGKYQRKYAGDIERQVTGGGDKFFSDGLRDTTILETKLVTKPKKSPFIPGTDIPDSVRAKIVGEVEGEFTRIAKIVADPANPLKSVEVIVSDQRAVPFFESLLSKHNIPGNVVVRPE